MTSLAVITPSYNQGQFIERTIQSVLSQLPAGQEYWVFDGGSQDETVSILKKYQDRLHWVSEKDDGQADAVNKGLRATHGEIIAWLNSDDVYFPGAFQEVLTYFDLHPEVDMMYGNADMIDIHDQTVEPYPTEPWNFKRLIDDCYICQPAAFFRRRVVDRLGYLDPRLQYTLDYEYWIRLALGGAVIAYHPVKLAGSRTYPATKTIRGKLKVHYEVNDMMLKKFGRVPDRWLFNFGHAYLFDRGITQAQRVRFAFDVSAVSLWAALHWNKRISRDMLHTSARWIGGSLHQQLKGGN